MATTVVVGALKNEALDDDAVWVPGSEIATLPATNLGLSNLSKLWRSTDTDFANARATATLAALVDVGTLAFVEANFSDTALIQFRAHSLAAPTGTPRDFATSTITSTTVTGDHLDVDENPSAIDANAIVTTATTGSLWRGQWPGDPTSYQTGAGIQIVRLVGTAPGGGDAVYVVKLFDGGSLVSTLRTFTVPAGLTQDMFTAFDSTDTPTNPGPQFQVEMTGPTGIRLEAIDIIPTTPAEMWDFDSGLFEVYPSSGAGGLALGSLKMAQSGFAKTAAFNLSSGGVFGNFPILTARVNIADGQNPDGFVQGALFAVGPSVHLEGTQHEHGLGQELIGDRWSRILTTEEHQITPAQLADLQIGAASGRKPLAVVTLQPGKTDPGVLHLPMYASLDAVLAEQGPTAELTYRMNLGATEERGTGQ